MSATKTTLVAVLVVILTFGAGFAAGVFTGHITALRALRPERLPEFATRAMVHRLDRKLELTDEQRTQVTQILERRRAAITGVRSDTQTRLRAEIDKANAEIARVLTPEQRAAFETMKMRMGPHGGGHWHQRGR